MSSHTFFCVDGHTAGMPVRMVVGGAPRLDGADQSERRQHFLAEYDWIRTSLMFEPRGHEAMSGSIIYPPSSDAFDLGVIFIETSGSLPMCGHGTIGTVTFAVERGLVRPADPGCIRLETPAGLVVAHYQQDGDKVTGVRLTNVPSFLLLRDLAVEVPELGPLTVDVAYGGNFYAIVESQEGFRDLADFPPDALRRFGVDLMNRINETADVRHPTDPTIAGVSHCQWTGVATKPEADGRNCVIAGARLIDRSPCGTGTSARMAQRAARGLMATGDSFVHESIVGSTFTGRIEAETTVANLKAIVPSVEGRAFITGFNTLFVDDNEPYREGFLL